MPVQRRRRQTGPFANARRCWRTSGRATPSLRCASSGTFSSDCCTIPTPDSRTPRGSLLDAKGGHDWKRFDRLVELLWGAPPLQALGRCLGEDDARLRLVLSWMAPRPIVGIAKE